MPIMIICPLCHGKGKVPPTDAVRRTLSKVSKGWRSTKQIAKLLAEDMTVNGVANRLRRLEAAHMVASMTRGKEKIWRRP